MPKKAVVTKRDAARIDRAVAHFVQNRHLFKSLAESLVGHLTTHPELAQQIHFIKWRVKEASSLKEKLRRKVIEEKTRPVLERSESISESNLFERVVDLAGVRILHLHTEQIRVMHQLILGVLDEHRYTLKREPTANCWDIEYEKLFQEFGFNTVSRESMYTTIHYDVVANQRTKLTCELQVRSLMDEVWSEVSHRINYPSETPIVSCRDQLKVLARLTTGGTRLVDSIFKSHRVGTDS